LNFHDSSESSIRFYKKYGNIFYSFIGFHSTCVRLGFGVNIRYT
jgi:hypothetical protein